MTTSLQTSQTKKLPLDVSIRWLIRRDMPEVLKIERESFEFPWTDEDFLSRLSQRNCIGMVAEHDYQVVGFMVYELHKARIHILNFAVGSEYRRMDVGTQMMLRLVNKISQQHRNEVILEVRERNLDAQLFFKHMNFRAISAIAEEFRGTDEGTLIMRYRPEQTEDSASSPPEANADESRDT